MSRQVDLWSVFQSLISVLPSSDLAHTCIFQDFASEGLRTLMIAYRELDNTFFQTWIKKHSEACLTLEDRERKLNLVYEEAERDLMVSMQKTGGETVGMAARRLQGFRE